MTLVSQLLRHQTLVIAGMQTAGVIFSGVSQSLVHQLVTVAISIHLGPVVLRCRAGQVTQCSHPTTRSVGPRGHYGWPLVRPVRVLLHVLGKVGLLGVGLAAVGADVGLQMLGLLVLGNMFQQRLFIREALVAGVAFVRLVHLVAPTVRLKIGELRKGFCTPCKQKKDE